MHTKEPWIVAHGSGTLIIVDGRVPAIAMTIGDGQEANARRIVACVNACAGIETERLSHGVVLENAQRVALERWDFKAQRDDILAIVEGINARRQLRGFLVPQDAEDLIAAIAKVTQS